MITRPMKFISLLLLLTFTGLGATTSTAFSENLSALLTGDMAKFAPYDAPRPVKDFTFLNARGEEEKLSDYQGKVVLVNFWATWCGPCREEMPSLDRLQAELGGDDFVVLAVGQDLQGMEKVTQFFEKYEIRHLAPINDKSSQSSRSAGAFGLPSTLILNAEGKEVGRLVGPAEWDSLEAKALIKYYMTGS
ncbi:MAG: redoxin [Sneathiella sp.]|nr:redoxin [Sneathiella sp.]